MNTKLDLELARLGGEISALVTECDLPLQDANVVRAYVDRQELGVALEALCDLLIETENEITETQCRGILDAARALGMLEREPRAWAERMQTLLARVRPGV